MKRFNFRLQKVMEMRQWNEKLSQQRMAEAQRQREEARRNVETAETAVQQHDTELVKQMNRDIQAGDALTHLDYAAKLRGDARAHADTLQEREESVTQRRGELVEASRDKKTIETLRDRRFVEHQKVAQRAEQAILDEIGGQRHLKKMTSERRNG